MVAFTILLIVLVPVALLLGNVIGQAASSRERLTALSLAEQYLDKLNNTPFGATRVNQTPTITSLPKTGVQLLQKSDTVHSTIAYSIYAEFTWTTSEGASDLCTSGLSPQLLDLLVTVKWGPSHEITDTTLIDYPPAGLVKNAFLAVQVNGDPASGPPVDARGHAWRNRVAAVPVTITSLPTGTSAVTPFSRTVYPNDHGCVFEEVPVPPGSYEVTVSDPTPGTPAGTAFGSPSTPSWTANLDEQTTQAQSPFTVTVGQVTLVTFTYDEGSLVDLRYPTTTATEGGVTCPGAGAIVCVVPGQAPLDAARPSSTPTAELSVLTTSGWTVIDPPGMTRLAAFACAGTTRCVGVGAVGVGTGFSGASVSTPTSGPSFSSDPVPAGVTALDGLSCPSTNRCYAYGQGTSGAVVLSGSVTQSGVTWTLDSGLGGVTTISGLACPSAATCYAIGSTGTAATILSLGASTTWAVDALPATPPVTSLSQVACPGTGTCYAIGSSGTAATILSLGASTTWAVDALPATPPVTSLSQVMCPSTATCFAVGTISGTASSAGILSTATGTTWQLDTMPSTVKALGKALCLTTTRCYVVGSTSVGPAIFSSSGSTWSTDGVPSGLESLSDLACATSSHCFATGTATSASRDQATLLSLSSATTWATEATSSGISPVFYSGVACVASTCVAPGASETGAIFLEGTPTGSKWTSSSPSGVSGSYVADVPISVSSSSLEPASTIEMAVPSTPTADLTQIGPLFPFTGGYSVAAAECKTEMAYGSTATSVPGATATASLAMGLLPVEVVGPSGSPVAGATVSASIVVSSATRPTPTTPTYGTCTPLTPLSGTNPTSFSLERTGPQGLSELAVIYDKYRVTVTAPGGLSGSATVTVGPTATTVGGTSYPLPEPVEIPVS